MSSVVIAGDTSGTVTLDAPAVAGSTVLTLPATSGTVFVGGQALSATTGSFSGNVTLGSSVLATPTGSAPSYLCRAWVNFNGTGTVAIRGSGNVSSITDNGTGAYTVNFTTAMPDVNYAYCGGSSTVTTDGRFQTEYIIRTTTTFSVATQNAAQNVTDSTYVNLAFFR
jgi:hypothetical protein